jgi:hypothetical protein
VDQDAGNPKELRSVKTITKQIRSERRKRAEAMKVEYDKLTLQQKFDQLPIDGAKKQKAKLAKLLEGIKTK